ncbi:hypothetical protein TH53_13475 [Pedobacter lusitanus]|uniref:Uncharacterized protein n=1 Tax=Pedobacter lusitanus TaxID=1503925 RepID=A0A0D0F4Z6_9SPHI|nr:hypothetical protein [Pedobacter lusitanus]KIO76683.1 hypothetical protein TH53_13475 [Pedobacter lusitanus]
MIHDVDDNEWKQEAPYLASLKKENPFSVPEQYFNTLPELIHNVIYVSELREAIPVAGFTVPEQYFDHLQDHILAETAASRLQNLPKTEGFHTPDLYFQKLQASILAKTTGTDLPLKREPKLIRLWHNDLIKYASAACFILVTAFGLYLNQQNFNAENRAADMASEQMLYDINEQDIIDHIEGNNVDIQNDNTANADLETYILNNYSQSDLSSAL